MNVDVVVLWVCLVVVTTVIAWLNYVGRLEAEKTLRQAIEKGTITDAEALERLRRAGGVPWKRRLVAWAIVTASLAVGVALFALSISDQDQEAVRPLLGIAALLASLAGGLAACGFWLGKESDVARR